MAEALLDQQEQLASKLERVHNVAKAIGARIAESANLYPEETDALAGIAELGRMFGTVDYDVNENLVSTADPMLMYIKTPDGRLEFRGGNQIEGDNSKYSFSVEKIIYSNDQVVMHYDIHSPEDGNPIYQTFWMYDEEGSLLFHDNDTPAGMVDEAEALATGSAMVDKVLERMSEVQQRDHQQCVELREELVTSAAVRYPQAKEAVLNAL